MDVQCWVTSHVIHPPGRDITAEKHLQVATVPEILMSTIEEKFITLRKLAVSLFQFCSVEDHKCKK